MRMFLTLIAVIAIIDISVMTQNIVDFTYSHLEEHGSSMYQSSKVIGIKPDRSVIQGYSFPDACYIARKLEEDQIQNSKDLSNYDMDLFMDGIKTDLIEMLQVS